MSVQHKLTDPAHPNPTILPAKGVVHGNQNVKHSKLDMLIAYVICLPHLVQQQQVLYAFSHTCLLHVEFFKIFYFCMHRSACVHVNQGIVGL